MKSVEQLNVLKIQVNIKHCECEIMTTINLVYIQFTFIIVSIKRKMWMCHYEIKTPDQEFFIVYHYYIYIKDGNFMYTILFHISTHWNQIYHNNF